MNDFTFDKQCCGCLMKFYHCNLTAIIILVNLAKHVNRSCGVRRAEKNARICK